MKFGKSLKLGLLVAGLLLSWSIFAGVNLKNGNFYITYSDINVPGGGHDLKVNRTYNSRSVEKGYFGLGWGSNLETNIKELSPTQIEVHEHGAGQRVVFTKKGDVYYNSNGGPQTVRKTAKGYERQSMNGTVEQFDKNGKILKIKDRDGYELTFNYDGGSLKSLKDSQSKQLFFEWYSSGRIKQITGPDRKPATYTYENDRLVKVKDVADHEYTYDYDGNWNMTQVSYKDGTTQKIKYDPKSQFVREVTYPSGQVKKYTYGSNAKNPDNDYWTTVTEKGLDGKERSSKYAYLIGNKADGQTFTKRLITEIDGQRTETEYSPQNELPLKITRGNRITTFTYNDRNLLASKNASGEITKLEYHPSFNKITKVTDPSGVTEYKYDKKGNLSEASDQARKLQLVYDAKGRITTMLSSEKGKKGKTRKLEFTYNSLGRPVVIKMDKVGQLNVTYHNNGQVNTVETKVLGSPAGKRGVASADEAKHLVSEEITETFRMLLAMVRPAGVDLSL